MKLRPTIFLSGVSHEFGTFRDAIENEIEMKGCFAENQPGFPPDYHTVEEMLRRKLADADAVIHITGFRFGAEPNQRPPGTPRRSYTQIEFDIAREMQKPVYVFISTDPALRDPPQPTEQPQDAEADLLQSAHLRAVQKTNHLYYFFKDKAELCKLVAEIPPVHSAGFHADISRIDKYAPAELIGREAELKLLDDAWLKVRRAESPRPHILTFVALGGEGKTSLVAKWAATLAHHNWPGCDAAFAWSFYSQGTRDQMAASSDLFLKEALLFFGDPEMANSAQSAFDKGRRLAHLIGQRRALLILDGLEPLQYSPASPTPGELKDQGLAALLKALAAANNGLCVVTTRYSIPDLKNFWQSTAPEIKLLRLSREHGVRLLQSLGVQGSLLRNIPFNDDKERVNEFEKLVEDVKGHALTLTLLGGFLKRAFHGDIRQRDRIKFDKADEKMDGGHAFRIMAVYEQWLLRDGGDEGKRQVAVLRLMGLFDRPADAGCIAALRGQPIPGLTDPLADLADEDWEFCLTGLEAAKLLTINRDASLMLVSLDAHPHLRAYFAKQLSEKNSESWRAGHKRLYEHLRISTNEGKQPALETLQPLYQAVSHGCLAELHNETHDDVYFARICRWHNSYSSERLGAHGSNLGADACFFDTPWTQLAPAIREENKIWLLNNTGMNLRYLGRLTEALTPLRIALESGVKKQDWGDAARASINLAELHVASGDVVSAIAISEQSVAYADRNGDSFIRSVSRCSLADALHQAGHHVEAEIGFRDAETIQGKGRPHPLLYSFRGFRYCDLLLGTAERAAWGLHEIGDQKLALQTMCKNVHARASRTLQWTEQGNGGLVSAAFDHLTLGRSILFSAIFERASFDICRSSIERAVDVFRRAGRHECLPSGLLTRAWLRSLTSPLTGPDSAQSDLDEAWEIAERGPMKLFMADIHLHRARLFFRETNYPWNKNPNGTPRTPANDLAAAEKLINDCGYHRRDQELADAKKAILGI